jgi:hypothetical protein
MLNQFTGYGQAQIGGIPFTMGKVFAVVGSAAGNASFSQLVQELFPVDQNGEVRFFQTVKEAYGATVSGRNDIILLSANSSHTLTEMLTVSKDRVHFWSADYLVGRAQDQRCRVQMGVTTAITDVAAVKVTGNGCSFRGIKFINSNTLAQSITCFYDVSTNGLLVEDCSIHSLGSAQLTAVTGSALKLEGDGSEYKNCNIGADTTINTVANQVVDMRATASKAKRCMFVDCMFRTYSSANTHVFARAAAGSIERNVFFKDCDFLNYTGAGGTALAVTIASAADTDGIVYAKNPATFGCTAFATAAVGNNVDVLATVPTAGTSGIAIATT